MVTRTPLDDTYDEIFAKVAAESTVFSDKAALDPLTDPDEIVGRADQERTLARVLHGVDSGYLPNTLSIHGPPGTGKTLTTRRLCEAYAGRSDSLGYAYVNLKECRTIFSAANEILFELAGEKRGAHEGLDGVFEAIWNALEAYPEWTVLVLDEVDQIRYDSNYDPSDFLYRLLRGEGRRKRGLQLSVWLVSNQLLSVDLRLDSRVKGVMGGEEVFFEPYDLETLHEIVTPRLEEAFKPGKLPEHVRYYGLEAAADRWGDVRKTMTLFRRAGETADAEEFPVVAEFCVDANLEGTEREAVIDKLDSLPRRHQSVLMAITGRFREESGEIIQPVTTTMVADIHKAITHGLGSLTDRAIRETVSDLEMMGLVETWNEPRTKGVRVKLIQTTFDPEWVSAAFD